MNNSIFELFVMLIFGIIGYLFNKFDFEPAPMILALVLGTLMEDSLRQALIISHGNLSVFIMRPISAFFIAVIVVSAVLQAVPWIRKQKTFVPKDET